MQFEGFIEIKPGYWYCEKTTLPSSNCKRIYDGHGCKVILTDKLTKLKPHNIFYYNITSKGKTYMWHRLVYEYFKGPIPEGLHVDHRDNNPFNNHPDNLQLKTNKDNVRKKSKQKNNTSGYPGVCWCKARNLYVTAITINRKLLYLGGFCDPKEAFVCFLENKIYYHGWESILPLI